MLFNEKGNTLERFINEVNSEDRNAVSRFIHDLISWLKARLKGEKVSLKIVKLKNRFAAVLRNVDTNAQKNNTTNDGDVKSSIEKDADGNLIVVVNTNQGIFVGAQPSEYSKIARQYFNEHFKGTTLPLGQSGDAVSMSKKLPGEYAYPHTTLDNNSNEYRAKMKAITELDNLLATAKEHYFSDDTKGNPEATLGWDYYEVEFLCDGMQVSGLINIANSENGRAFYDMTKIKVASAISEKYVALLARSPFTSQKATNNKVSQKDKGVNTHYTQESENYSSPEQDNDENSYSFEDIDVYDEAQYNDYGWVTVNGILTGKELKQLYSQFADIKLLKHKCPKTPKGEYIIFTGHNYGMIDSVVFIKGTNKHPIITKIYTYKSLDKTNREISANEVSEYEQRGYDNANEIIEAYAGHSVFSRYTLRDCLSYWEQKRQGFGTASNKNSGKRNFGTGSAQQNKTTDKAGLDDSAFSMHENDGIEYSLEDDVVDKTSSLAEPVRLGEISQTEYLNELQRLMNEATEKYGAIPKGENPKVDVTVPKQVSDKRNTRRKNNKKES